MPTFWAALALLAQDDVYTVTYRYERIHCEECRSETAVLLKRLPGATKVEIRDDSASAVFPEKTAPAEPAGFPRDIRYKGAVAVLRGTVSEAGGRLRFQARGSEAAFGLAGEAGVLESLKRALGGKNRFRLTARLEGKSLGVEAFETADW
jgi:hypothetical protein